MEIFRKLPVNYKHEDRLIFSHEIEKSIPVVGVLKLKNVLINSTSYFLSTKKTYPESVLYHLSVVNYNSKLHLSWNLLKKIIDLKFHIVGGQVCLISDSWSGGYFHWLLDSLPRLLLVLDEARHQGVVLSYDISELTFVRESLALLGINNIRTLKNGHWYYFRKISFPKHLAPTGNYNDVIIKRLRSVFLKEERKSEPNKLIYISRKLASKRRILNEGELIYLLESYGFETILCENMTFTIQLKLFSQTKYLISNHGAGLSNMLFMEEKSKVLELRAVDDSHNNCYFSLASALGIDYYYQLCSKQNRDEDPHTADMFVDLCKLEKNIINFLSA